MGDDLVAIVPAAGSGRRFGSSLPKQFLELGGKPLIVHALEALESTPEVREIILVLHPDDVASVRRWLGRYGISKARQIAHGGKERQDSVQNGLSLIAAAEGAVLVHDAVRPFFERDFVRKALEALGAWDGVVPGVTPKETVKELDGEAVKKTLDRGSLRLIQTPQVFRLRSLREAYGKALAEGFTATDDAALVEQNGGRVKVLPGSYLNIKITTPEDLEIAGLYLRDGICLL